MARGFQQEIRAGRSREHWTAAEQMAERAGCDLRDNEPFSTEWLVANAYMNLALQMAAALELAERYERSGRDPDDEATHALGLIEQQIKTMKWRRTRARGEITTLYCDLKSHFDASKRTSVVTYDRVNKVVNRMFPARIRKKNSRT